MKMKRIALILLSLVMVFSTLVIVPVAAEGAIVLPDAGYKGVADEDKLTVDGLKADSKTVKTMDEYYAEVTVDNNVKTFTDTYVSISTPDQWKKLANMVGSKGNWAKSTKNVTFFLTGNLDFDGVTGVTPVGIKYGYFKNPLANGGKNEAANVGWQVIEFQGHFNGNGYTIKNLTMETSEYHTGEDSNHRGTSILMGLFSSAGTGVTIKNLVIDSTCYFAQNKNDDLGGYMGAAALLGGATGNVVIENVYNKANVKGGTHAAGIVGRDGAPTIINCTNDGTLEAGNTKGGIIGWTANATVTGCVNNGTIIGNGAGGICGRTRGAAKVTDCINNGVLTGGGNNVNGIIAAVEQTYSATITNCVNTARFNLDWFKSNTATYLVRGISNHVGTGTITYTNCQSVLEPIAVGVYAGYSEWRVGAPVDLSAVVDINDYEANATATKFKITDPAGLNKFSALVAAGTDNFSGDTVYLANDLDMSATANFVPIGHFTDAAAPSHAALGSSKPFKGIFDGQGHTIEGITASYKNGERSDVGLFGYIDAATVKNVVIGASCSFTLDTDDGAYSGCGAVVGRNGGTVQNCANYGSVNALSRVAGIAGRAGKVIQSTNFGTIRGTGQAAGISTWGGTTENNVNYGTVMSSGAAMGITFNITALTNCVNYGSIIGGAQAAGIAINRKSATLTNCENYGSVATTSGQAASNNGKLIMSGLAAQEIGNNANYPADAKYTYTNCIDAPGVGYDVSKIVDVDLSYVSDIEDLFEITEDGVTQLKEGKTYAAVIKITSAEGWRLFASVINNYDTANRGKHKTFYLADDIDLSGYTFDYTDLALKDAKHIAPVGFAMTTGDGGIANTAGFKGTFNGLGHTVSNLKLDGGHIYKNEAGNNAVHGDGYIGLFGAIYQGMVSNVVIDESAKLYVNTGMVTHVAGIAAWAAESAVVNCWNQASYGESHWRTVSGIVSMAKKVAVLGCTNSGDMIALNGTGGIIGNASDVVTVVDCRNVGNISSGVNASFKNAAGGIVGVTFAGNNMFVNNANYGEITTASANKLNGGILGEHVHSTGLVYALNCYDKSAANTLIGTIGDNLAVTDATGTKADGVTLNNVEDTAYAEEMLKVWFQTNAEGDVRLVTTVDSLVYDKIVLTITNSADQVATVELTGVYTSILAGEITSEVLNAGNWGADTSKYFAALTITDAAGQTFTVQASAYIGDTAVLTGAERTVVVD